ncbi:Hypothetical predicted protein [Octopus vulgaris]|uniref:Uncharacterized protein n=1 Tax=Octopus vulgaris TaxID=6645 RepID=A0AA36FGB7_OCTVU|nr:Hypothetical predicted protein [Octopus vulgaris]
MHSNRISYKRYLSENISEMGVSLLKKTTRYSVLRVCFRRGSAVCRSHTFLTFLEVNGHMLEACDVNIGKSL